MVPLFCSCVVVGSSQNNKPKGRFCGSQNKDSAPQEVLEAPSLNCSPEKACLMLIPVYSVCQPDLLSTETNTSERHGHISNYHMYLEEVSVQTQRFQKNLN